ncbi:MAG: methyltransferase domain-containing protein [Chitinophagaceae bacterium]|nr:MAG: methyltransferase domain-containing protein [Chitinophagaceae bacterium]
MPSFRTRTNEKELLDRDDIPFADIARNMEELDVINTRLGGHAITLRGLQVLLQQHPKKKSISVLEIGCGGGDNLRVLKAWAERNGLQLELSGLDYNPACISFAQGRSANDGIRFLCCDYRDLPVEIQPDIIFSSLFCHHFTDAELREQLQWMQQRSRLGFFINDLHRHPLAYHSIRLITSAFSKSYLVRNDAPLSVRRGFQRKEWLHLLQEAGIHQFTCSWQWAFRWLIIAPNHAAEATI